MSWSFQAIGKPHALANKAKDYLTQFKCAEPEETIKTNALAIIETSLRAMPETAVVRLDAHGSQSAVSGGLNNQIHLKIEPVYGFVE